MADVMIPIAILLVVFGALALVALRQPLLGRLAVREAIRRPGQSILLIAGMMLGTAAILGMQGIGDTLVKITTAQIYANWGRVDITVTQGGQLFSQEVAKSLLADPQIANGAAGVQGGYQLAGSVSDVDRRLSTTPVQVTGLDTTQPGFYKFGLKDGSTIDGAKLQNGGAIITSTLAARLEARPGDRVQLDFVIGGKGRRLTAVIAGITKEGAFGVIGVNPGIFVPLADVQQVAGIGTINIVRISASGAGQPEVDHARVLFSAVQKSVSGHPGGEAFQIHQVKAEDLAALDNSNSALRPVFLVLSLFVVLAATALVVNLSLAMSEERRPRLAVLRALGLSRRGLISVVLIEGGIYSLAGGLVGILPGLAYTYLVAAQPLPGALGSSLGIKTADEVLTISGGSIALSVCIGTLITLLTILAVSIRTSRMAISAAVRDLPEPPALRQHSWFRTVRWLAVGLAGAAATIPDNPALRLFGGAAIIVATSRLVPGGLSERVRTSLAGAGLIAWSVLVVATADSGAATAAAILPNLAALVVCVFGATFLLSANMRVLGSAGGASSARLAALLRPPLAYLSRRPARSGLAIGTFALILAVLAWFAVALPTVEGGGDLTGGYDVRVTTLGASSITLPADLQSEVAGSQTLATMAYTGPIHVSARGFVNGWQSSFVLLYALTDEQLAHPPAQLGTRDPHYSSDEDVWQAVRADPSLVVAAGAGSSTLGTIEFVGRTGAHRLRVIGDVSSLMVGGDLIWTGMLGAPAAFSDLATSGAGATALLKLRQGVDSRTFATELRRAAFGQGVDAVAAADLIALNNQSNDFFNSFFTLLLQTGVVVGVLSLGFLALRAAIERKRAIGVLRALGYMPGQVLKGLLIEAGLTASIGIVVGIAVGLGLGLLLVRAFGTAHPDIAWSTFLAPAVLIYAAVFLMTIVPAIRASRMPVAEALRIVG